MKSNPDTIDYYWRVYGSINEWIRFADTKAIVVLTIYGIALTIVYSNSIEVYHALSASKIQLVLSMFVIVSSATSITLCFHCLNPRLKNKNPKSIIYYGHISAGFKNFQEYADESNLIFNNRQKTALQLAEQIHVNSIIAWKKFQAVSWAVRFFYISQCLIGLSISKYLFL